MYSVLITENYSFTDTFNLAGRYSTDVTDLICNNKSLLIRGHNKPSRPPPYPPKKKKKKEEG